METNRISKPVYLFSVCVYQALSNYHHVYLVHKKKQGSLNLIIQVVSVVQFTNYQISDRTTNYQMNENGAMVIDVANIPIYMYLSVFSLPKSKIYYFTKLLLHQSLC